MNLKIKYGWLLLLIGVFYLPANTQAADSKETYRFAEQPWGLDSPAGRCVVCHSLEKNGPHRVAPNLWGIVGAQKASESWYNYSPALRAKGGVWTDKELDEFLTDANQYAPGSTKSIKVKDAEERKAIIDFLKTLH
jgi:cytochrome c